MGNGQKAQMKRDRAAKDKAGGAKSQLKVNEAAKNVQCQVCRQTFLLTIRQRALEEHVENKHTGKDFKSCFPTYVPA
ncbi:hypothetical protein HDU85_007202 [Gaertneriomyces sp. JEL0708]|nr:At2g23090 like protein [Gaertneriomyces semiglobifer]KAJ3187164.1 hypothetical protein HDU85_007202 [Gaertneriomyces sp. JEL0708]